MSLSLKVVWPKRHFGELKLGERFRIDDEAGGAEYIKSQMYEDGTVKARTVGVNLTTGVAIPKDNSTKVGEIKTEVPVSSLYRDWLCMYGNGFYSVAGEDNNKTRLRNIFTGCIVDVDPCTPVYWIESITFGMAG